MFHGIVTFADGAVKGIYVLCAGVVKFWATVGFYVHNTPINERVRKTHGNHHKKGDRGRYKTDE